MMQSDAITGALLGCAVGDALGLPYEGLSRRRAAKLFGPPTRYHFVFGHGMVSDDTEHSCLLAESLCKAPCDVVAFQKDLARRLRWWLLGLPAGIGSATLRSIMRLWLGYGPETSGVFSAGNGPAMRSPILGAAIDDLAQLQTYVQASTRMTHSDPKAYYGAMTVALAAWCAKRGIHTIAGYFDCLRKNFPHGNIEFDQLMDRVKQSLAQGESTQQLAESIGCQSKVTGYIYHTVPVVIHAWLSHPHEFQRPVEEVIELGGDTDTTAAILGGILGAGLGCHAIPQPLLSRLWEWPRGVAWMIRLSEATTKARLNEEPVRPPYTLPLVGLLRNLVFLVVVLWHAVRRLLPPY